MSDYETLHRCVLADPADDTLRFVLADLLRESDDPDLQAQGRFLWGGMTAAQFRHYEVIDDQLYYTALQEIGDVTSAGFPAGWLSELDIGPQPLNRTDWAWDSAHDRVDVRIGQTMGTFTRGMLSELSVSLNDWYTHAPLALAKWPLASGTILDATGLRFEIVPDSPGWRLTARLVVPARRVLLGGGLLPAAVAPLPTLREESGDWHAVERFPDRTALLAGLTRTSMEFVQDLRAVAGDRWPSPQRRSSRRR